MIDLPLILTTRTCFSDECYGVIGRALAFATSFECNCWALEALTEMKRGLDFPDEKSMAEFCKKLGKKLLGCRTKDITKLLKKGAESLAEKDMSCLVEFLATELGEKLEDARKARNEIAHDLTKGIEHYAEDDGGRKNIIKNVEKLVRRLAEADVEVYNLCRIITKEPRFVDASGYCEAAVKWVCEIEDSP